MDEFIIFAIIVKCIVLLGLLYLTYRAITYIGFSGSMFLLSISLFLALGYFMFYV
jgi:hypothetical protein